MKREKKYREKKVSNLSYYSLRLLNLDFKKDIIKHGQLNIQIYKGLTEYSYGSMEHNFLLSMAPNHFYKWGMLIA